MRVEMAGWSRDCGAHKIAEVDLAKLDALTGVPGRYDAQKTYIYPNPRGEVVVERKAGGIVLNGNFLLSLQLTPEDVAAMARIAFKGMPFEKVAALLAAKG
jgi:hypothetical protein